MCSIDCHTTAHNGDVNNNNNNNSKNKQGKKMAAWTTSNAFGPYDVDDGDNDDDIISLQSESMHSMIDAFPVTSSSAAAARFTRPAPAASAGASRAMAVSASVALT